MGFDYSNLTDEQLQAIADKDYSKLPDNVLVHLADEHDNSEKQGTELSKEALATRNDPLNTAAAGAVAGGFAGAGSKGLEFAKAIENLSRGKALVEPVAPTPPPKEYFAPGQKYMAKTGHGSGPGLTQEEVIAHQRAQEAPLGRGKVASRITGPASPDQILAAATQREADDKVRARVFAQEKLLHDREQAEYAAKQKEYLKQKNALAQEKKFGLPNKIGTTKAVTGGTAGYNALDLANQIGEGDYGQATLSGAGIAGGAAPYIKKLHPRLRAIGTGLSFLAPAVNRGIDTVEEKANGGLVGLAGGGKFVEDAAKAALKKLNLSDFEGKTLLGTLSDRTMVGGKLKGGPMFPTLHENAAWAMNAPGAASRLINAMQAAGGPESTIVAPMLMKNTAHKSNRDVADMATNQFKQNYESGLFTPERLAEIENNIRKVPGLQNHPGLLHPEAEDLLHNMTFNQRGKLVNWLGSKAKTAPAMDLQKLLRETAEPGLFDEPLGAVGPSVFKLTGEQSHKPGLHNSYDYIVHGEPVGKIDPIPREFLFRDLESKANKELGRPLSDYNYRTSVGVPSQLIDDKLLKSLDELGYLKAKGGTVQNLATGGTPLRYVSNWLLKNADELGNLPLKRPVHLADEAKLQGFTSPEQNVFYGTTKTGQEFTIPREYVDPTTISHSYDKNKTADFIRSMFENYKKPE